MLIDAPFTVGVTENPDTLVRELHMTFIDEFKSEPMEKRSIIFKKYIIRLESEVTVLDSDDPNIAGMQLISQISNELLPHVIEDEIPLQETIIIEIRQDLGLGSLIKNFSLQ